MNDLLPVQWGVIVLFVDMHPFPLCGIWIEIKAPPLPRAYLKADHLLFVVSHCAEIVLRGLTKHSEILLCVGDGLLNGGVDNTTSLLN
jgi:hypothetical protein